GAQYADPSGINSAGCAVVYRYQGPSLLWVEEAQLVDSNAAASDLAGRAVGVDGATIVVASPNAKVNGWLDAGAVNVFTFNGTTWSQTAEIDITSHSTHPTFDHFGTAVAISGSRVAATAVGEDLPPV